MRPPGKPKLLCLGHDFVLNRTRRLILEKSFDVTLAEELPEAAKLLPESAFAVVLLCYSLTEEESRAALEMVHRVSPEARILMLSEGRLALGPRDQMLLYGGPADLLKKAASMAGIPVEATGKPRTSADSSTDEQGRTSDIDSK